MLEVVKQVSNSVYDPKNKIASLPAEIINSLNREA